jgi:hypothetical protein
MFATKCGRSRKKFVGRNKPKKIDEKQVSRGGRRECKIAGNP